MAPYGTWIPLSHFCVFSLCPSLHHFTWLSKDFPAENISLSPSMYIDVLPNTKMKWKRALMSMSWEAETVTELIKACTATSCKTTPIREKYQDFRASRVKPSFNSVHTTTVSREGQSWRRMWVCELWCLQSTVWIIILLCTFVAYVSLPLWHMQLPFTMLMDNYGNKEPGCNKLVLSYNNYNVKSHVFHAGWQVKWFLL